MFQGSCLNRLAHFPEKRAVASARAIISSSHPDPGAPPRRGTVPEVVMDGVTGFVVERIESALKAVAPVEWLNRRDCRNVFEGRFDAARMARDYVEVYRLLGQGGLGWTAPSSRQRAQLDMIGWWKSIIGQAFY